MDLFPSMKSTTNGFHGAIVSVLMEYPLSVASRITNPSHGLARESEFLSIAKIIAWLERHTEPMRHDRDREIRIERQMEESEQWEQEREEKDPVMLEKCKAWLDRTDPKAQQLTGTKSSHPYQQFLERCEKLGLEPRPIGRFEQEKQEGPRGAQSAAEKEQETRAIIRANEILWEREVKAKVLGETQKAEP
jgi:hypothetical protein